jgi:hypothetical protein
VIISDLRAVWVASAPRTGSMWTFNVVRDLVRGTGRQVLPEIVPHADEEMEAIGQAGIAARDGFYVLKVHSRLARDLPASFYVITHRDVRDSLVSFMRFMHCDFAAGLRFVASAIRLEQHYAGLPPARRLHVDYTDIVAAPEAVAGRVARRLGIEVSAFRIAEIVERYSKPRVEARLIAQEHALRQKLEARQPLDVREFVPLPDHTLRAFDLETGFQSGHVSAYQEGDWRQILTAAQKAAVTGLITEMALHQTDKVAS